MSTVLVVDDEPKMREFFDIFLTHEGYRVRLAATGEEAIGMLSDLDPDLIITDIRMPNGDGLAVLRAAKAYKRHLPVIMVTAYSSTSEAVEAMKLGAEDYITKPFQLEEIKVVIQKALAKARLEDENQYLHRELQGRYDFTRLVAESPVMKRVLEIIGQVGESRANVLITGESGTGKELVARALHFNSSRRSKRFVTVNCGALPEPLLESELFGHERGAFTGAVNRKKGLLELADGGTFFLDEIGEAPPSIQVKLLRVIETHEFRRVGGVSDLSVDVRIIAASNQELSRAVEEGRFREDLFYRLHVFPIHIPPLRERREDIPLLVVDFVRRRSPGSRAEGTRFSEEAVAALCEYSWPGNVRELENLVEQVFTLNPTGLIHAEDLPGHIRNRGPSAHPLLPKEGVNLEEILARTERTYLREALFRAGGVKKRAAELLNLSFRSLRYRLGKYHLEAGEEPADRGGGRA